MQYVHKSINHALEKVQNVNQDYNVILIKNILFHLSVEQGNRLFPRLI